MSYPRMSYGFSLILQLNTHFIARYLILAFGVNSRWNGQFLRPFWSREKKSKKLAGTSRRRVNKKRNSTSGQRRDASTSRRQRDFCLTIIKSKRDQKSRGIGKHTDEGMESRATANQISREDTCFCIFFSFLKDC